MIERVKCSTRLYPRFEKAVDSPPDAYGLSIKETLRRVIMACVFCLQGCSYGTVTTHKTHPTQCTTHYTAPIVDTGLTLYAAAGAAMIPMILSGASLSNDRGGNGELLVILGLVVAAPIVGGMSAHHGYSEVALCREKRQMKDAFDADETSPETAPAVELNTPPTPIFFD